MTSLALAAALALATPDAPPEAPPPPAEATSPDEPSQAVLPRGALLFQGGLGVKAGGGPAIGFGVRPSARAGAFELALEGLAAGGIGGSESLVAIEAGGWKDIVPGRSRFSFAVLGGSHHVEVTDFYGGNPRSATLPAAGFRVAVDVAGGAAGSRPVFTVFSLLAFDLEQETVEDEQIGGTLFLVGAGVGLGFGR